MLQELRPALVMMVLMTLLTGIAYPLALTGIVGVLISPVTWVHHLVWAVPAFVLIVQRGSRRLQIFAALSFAPPLPPRRVVREKAEPPQAPPLPFRYAGKLTQGGKTEVFVVRGEEIISIAAGQNIDAEYRVDELGPERIAFTYLPLKTRQSLELEEDGG